MKRLLWLGAGLAIGALVVRAVTRKARSYHPGSIAAAARDSGRNLLDSAREFIDDVRDGMHQREQELRAAFIDGVAIEDLAEADELAASSGLDEPGGGWGARPAPPPPEGTTR
jgi:hypothetical protein